MRDIAPRPMCPQWAALANTLHSRVVQRACTVLGGPEALAGESNARSEADLRLADRERRAAEAQRQVGGGPPVSSSPAPSDRDPEPDRSLAHESSDVG